jgi:LacI family transcriptional regulator, galactose operon repressor
VSASKHATIFDVAREAGVSKSTVSNVIRGTGGVAPDTRQRVQVAIEQLGYRPNVLARQLVQQRTTTLGVVVGDLGNPFYAEMAKQIERAAFGLGYRAMFCNTQGEQEAELAGLESLLEYRAAGILFLSHPTDRGRARGVVEGRVPAVFLTCAAEWGDVVSGDDEAGAELATQHLIDLGHQRIAYLADPIVEDSADRDRQSGYQRSMARAHLEPAVFHWDRPPGELQPSARDKQLERILRQRITAVFSSNDYGAIELLECADRLGVKVPQELSVVGFDDVVMAGLARINLTTVRQPQPELASLAVETLAARVQGELEGPPQRKTLSLELIVRGSTAPPLPQ